MGANVLFYTHSRDGVPLNLGWDLHIAVLNYMRYRNAIGLILDF